MANILPVTIDYNSLIKKTDPNQNLVFFAKNLPKPTISKNLETLSTLSIKFNNCSADSLPLGFYQREKTALVSVRSEQQ